MIKKDDIKINLDADNFYNVGMTSINTPTESIVNTSRCRQSGEKTSTLVS